MRAKRHRQWRRLVKENRTKRTSKTAAKELPGHLMSDTWENTNKIATNVCDVFLKIYEGCLGKSGLCFSNFCPDEYCNNVR